MKIQRDYRVLIIFLWLLGLTVFIACDRMNVKFVSRQIVLPPVPIEDLEVDLEVYHGL